MASVFTSLNGFIPMEMSEVPLFKFDSIINIIEKVGDGTPGLRHTVGKLLRNFGRTGMCQHIVELLVVCVYLIQTLLRLIKAKSLLFLPADIDDPALFVNTLSTTNGKDLPSVDLINSSTFQKIDDTFFSL